MSPREEQDRTGGPKRAAEITSPPASMATTSCKAADVTNVINVLFYEISRNQIGDLFHLLKFN